MIKNTFHRDNAFGKKYERLSLNYIDDYIQIVVAPDCKFSAYDYKVIHTNNPNKWVRYEVKTDRQCYRTGNFFIETHNKNGTPSGLLLTKSDNYILIVVDLHLNIEDLYIIPTQKIREFYNNGNHTYRSIEGLTTCANGFLLPRKELDEITVIG